MHKVLPLVPVPNEINPIYVQTLNLSALYYLPSKPSSSKWSLIVSFPHQIPICISLLSVCATSPAPL